MARSEGARGAWILTTLAVLGGIVTLIGGVAALVFLAKPGWRPCLGTAQASFSAAPVIPHVSFREYLIRQGQTYEDAQQEPDARGAEVRFTFESDGYRDEPLAVTWSLFEVDAAGDVLRVLPDQDRVLAMTVTPSRCTDKGGRDLFLQVPPNRSRRYQVLLELFEGPPPSNRIDLIQTTVFRG
jgi:hypothetical protein